MASYDDVQKKIKEGKVDFIDPVQDSKDALGQTPQSTQDPLDIQAFVQTYAVLLQALRTIKRPVASAPTFTPRTLTDQIQYYDSGGTRRLYLYISGGWRYVALT